MTNINVAFIGVDRVIADGTKRFEMAEQKDSRKGNLYWETALSGTHVHLDTPIEGAIIDIDMLMEADYKIVFLSSRPEHMRAATVAWLKQHGFSSLYTLIMKPKGAKWIKSLPWQVAEAQNFATYLNATEVLFVEQDEKIRDAFLDACREELPFLKAPYMVSVCSSLAIATGREQEQSFDDEEMDDHPF